MYRRGGNKRSDKRERERERERGRERGGRVGVWDNGGGEECFVGECCGGELFF